MNRISRRRFLGTAALAVGALGTLAVSNIYRFKVSKYSRPLRGLVRPIRVVQLSDLHFGPFIHHDSVVRFFEEAVRQKPDLIVITGDLIDGTSSKPVSKIVKQTLSQDIGLLIDALAILKAPLGIKVCWGNHDYYDLAGLAELYSVFSKLGIEALVNQGVQLRDDLFVAGVDDFWEGNPDAEQAMALCPSGVASLLLCHNPDYSFHIPSRVDLTLCGHTHGGQVMLPLVGAPWTPSKYGDRFAGGFYSDPIEMFVSRGLGVTGVPVRLGADPELVVFDFFPAT